MSDLHDTLRQLIDLCERQRAAVENDDPAYEDLDRQRIALLSDLPDRFPRDSEPLLRELHQAGKQLAGTVQAKRDEILQQLAKANASQRHHAAYHGGRPRSGGYQIEA